MLVSHTARWCLLSVLLLLCSITGCINTENDRSKKPVELTVSAAASLTDSLEKIRLQFESKHPHIRIHYNIGSSGALSRQIEQGAPVDLFLSADPKYVTSLADKQLILNELSSILLRNELVLIVPNESALNSNNSLNVLSSPEVKHIALGDPDIVPAGSFAKEALEQLKLWDTLKPKLVFTKDVRQVLTYVETANADAGFVYRTDASGSTRVRMAAAVDPGLHRSIEYVAAVIKSTKYPAEAQLWYEFLHSEDAGELFEAYGFITAR
jgi:molybdate transport system substrate-binding protein